MTAKQTAMPSSNASAPALRVEKLTKKFGERKAADGISFELPQGAFLSVFGPNGAGKTTLLRMLATLARPTSGTVEVLGVDAKEKPDEVRELIGIISHNSFLYPDLTAEENLTLYGKLYGVPNPEKRAAELLDVVGLRTRRHDRVRTFSRGMKQRAAIARALVNDPRIVLLDEPYSGLDPHAVEIVDELIESVRENRTFVMVSHDLEKGLALCTHALVLARGKVVRFSPVNDLDAQEFRALYRSTVGMGVA